MTAASRREKRATGRCGTTARIFGRPAKFRGSWQIEIIEVVETIRFGNLAYLNVTFGNPNSINNSTPYSRHLINIKHDSLIFILLLLRELAFNVKIGGIRD